MDGTLFTMPYVVENVRSITSIFGVVNHACKFISPTSDSGLSRLLFNSSYSYKKQANFHNQHNLKYNKTEFAKLPERNKHIQSIVVKPLMDYVLTNTINYF